jgi:hypothetical protein
MTRRTTRPPKPRTPSLDQNTARQQALRQALSAIPNTGDDWTVAVLTGSDHSGPDARDLYDRLESVFMVWAWHAGYRSWFAGVRALARAIRGLERADLIQRHTTRQPGGPPRRVWTLTDDGRGVAAALTGEGQ